MARKWSLQKCNDQLPVAILQRPVCRCKNATINRSLHKKMQRATGRCIIYATTYCSLQKKCNELLVVAFFMQRVAGRCKKNATSYWSLHIFCNELLVVAYFMQRATGRCKKNATSYWSMQKCNEQLVVAKKNATVCTTVWSLQKCNDQICNDHMQRPTGRCKYETQRPEN